MPKFNNISQQKFFRLLAVKPVISKDKTTRWECICDCGKITIVQYGNLINGHTKSCGCFRSEVTTKTKKTHGFKHHPLYEIWCKIKDRCLNENNPAYKNYGARGITICKEWINNPEAFINWSINNGWTPGLETDRINNDGNYGPDNCRFVIRSVNMMNRRVTAKFTYKGELLTTKELELINGIPARRIYLRIHVYNWSIERAISEPVGALKEQMKLEGYSQSVPNY